jgi:ketosteroid isomerase-like protein
MFHLIVRRVARRKFRQINDRDLDRFTTIFTEDSVFCMHGDHALGGELRGPGGVRTFFDRLQAVFPDLTIDPVTIIVSGWPWRTLVATHFRVHAHLADDTLYRNEGMQYLHLRWGKVVEDRLFEDTLRLAEAIELQAAAGVVASDLPPLGPLPAEATLGLRP